MFLVYPQICGCCGCNVLNKSHFCEVCQGHFDLLDPRQHCPFCFCESEGVCSKCVEGKRFRVKIGAAFDHVGAVMTHLGMVRKGMQVKMAASFLSVQFFRLGWEVPDLVISIPSRGSPEFARQFAASIGVRYGAVLKRGRRTLPQMRLPWKERYQLPGDLFYLKRSVEGKTVLLIDDLMGTGTTIRTAALALEGVKRVYALTLSRLLSL